MSSGGFLSIEPQELRFPFELKKQISCSLQLSNKTDNYIAFKVKTTNPRKYCVRPNTGVVLPRSTCNVVVTMQAQKEAPPDMQCKDKFLLQSVIANPGTTAKDVTSEMFNKESGNLVEEYKLRVSYVSPPQPPSPVPEGSEEGSSPRPSLSDNEHLNASEFSQVSRAFFDPLNRHPEGEMARGVRKEKTYLERVYGDPRGQQRGQQGDRYWHEEGGSTQQAPPRDRASIKLFVANLLVEMTLNWLQGLFR